MGVNKCIAYVILLFFQLISGQDSSPSCYEQGQCTHSLYITEWSTDDIEECLHDCQSEEDCQYFTFFQDDSLCYGFANCQEFDKDTCQECYSGAVDCQDVQCGVSGRCEGIFISGFTSSDSDECFDACVSEYACAWATFNGGDSSCTLLETCSEMDEECSECVSSQRFCTEGGSVTTTQATTTGELIIGSLSKIIVIAGDQHRPLDQVEVVDLLDPTAQCQLLAPYPYEGEGMGATLFDGKIKSCGGSKPENTSLCFDYDPALNSWQNSVSLPYPREKFAHSIINDKWYITGGTNVEDDVANTTTTWDGQSFGFGWTSPYRFTSHCQVTINSTHVFVVQAIGEEPSEGHAGRAAGAYIVEYETNHWQVQQNLTRFRDYGIKTSCGLIENSINGPEVVLAGEGYSEIFSLTTFDWREGPDLLPFGYQYEPVQLDGTFAFVGGYDGNFDTDTVYVFDRDKYEFVLMEQKLQIARSGCAAVAVPADYVTC